MKLFLSALCASLIIAPFSYAEGDCEKGKCDKDKKEGTMLVAKEDCGCTKCKEGTKCADCDKCKKAEDKLMASDCGKCKKEGAKEEEKAAGTLVGNCEKGCDKDKGDKEEKEAGTLA
ncbi:MAG: hypothetical protein H8M99_11180 [Gloeobacteraceae cyanobacterium ES-bin-144]|nr:hypothetical protein [Verrucomicrobiales bacterium]